MGIEDAEIHLAEAMKLLTLEAWRGSDPDNMGSVDHFTIAEELDRVDRAIGPKGSSMFAPIADAIRSAYVEIRAAKAAIEGQGG